MHPPCLPTLRILWGMCGLVHWPAGRPEAASQHDTHGTPQAKQELVLHIAAALFRPPEVLCKHPSRSHAQHVSMRGSQVDGRKGEVLGVSRLELHSEPSQLRSLSVPLGICCFIP
eukprot:292322-Chlamydomonas_euryale.AAC.2